MISSPKLVDTQIGFSGNSQIEHYDFGHDDHRSPIRGALAQADFENGVFTFVQNRTQSHDYLQTPTQHVHAYKYFPICLEGVSGSMNIKYEYDRANHKLFRLEVAFAFDELEWKPFVSLLEELVSQLTIMFNQLSLDEHGIRAIDLNIMLQILGSKAQTFSNTVQLQLPLHGHKVLHTRNNAQASLNLYSLVRAASDYFKNES